MKKTIAMLLLSAICLSAFAGCGGDEGNLNGPEGANTENGDDFMDNYTEIWSENEPFVPLADDASLDSGGTNADGSWFDSFQSVEQWTVNGQATVRQSGKKMIFTTNKHTGGTAARAVTDARNFEIETRMRVKQMGVGVGFYMHVGKEELQVYIESCRIRLNSSISKTDDCYMIEKDVGDAWHTYRLVMLDGVLTVYMDGAHLMSYTPNVKGNTKNEFAFMGRAAADNAPCILEIEYVGYKILEESGVKILSPSPAEICGTGRTDVEVRIESASSDPCEVYLNGVYAGMAESGKMTFSDLAPGVYRLYAKSGGEQSRERIFTVAAPVSGAKAESLLSDEKTLQSSYILRYTVSGQGKIEAGDGMFAFSRNYTAADAGAYIAVVDGGAAWIYRDGKLQESFLLPYGKCGTAVRTEGKVSGVRVEAHNTTVFKKDFSDGSVYDADMGAISYEYALEFEYTPGAAAEIRLNDGAYFLAVDIGADGIARGLDAPQEIVHAEELFTAADGPACYRISVSSGLAQIFVNNVWVKSLKLPQSYAARNLYVAGSGFGTVQIRECRDIAYWYADADEKAWNTYFCIDIENPAGGVAGHCLKNYARNTDISAEVDLSGAKDGVFLLAARYDGLGTGIFAGCDFAAGCFKIGTSVHSLQKLGTASLKTSGTAVLRLVLQDNVARLYFDGTLIGEKTVTVTGWGSTGYYSTAGVTPEHFSYTGDGGILGVTAETYTLGNHTVSPVEIGGALYICGETGTLLKSTDDGRTFTEIGRKGFLDKSFFNTVVTESGKIVSIVRTVTNFGIDFNAFVSSDGGYTYAGPYRVNKLARSNNATVNAKFMQTSSGRLVFVMENCYGEYNASAELYWSDDDGVTWTLAKTFDAPSAHGSVLQEGEVVELTPGVLRLYIRTDAGYLYSADSFDNGATWDETWTATPFVSVMSAFNVETDSYTGDLYMVWEYGNVNDYASKKAPRSRIALAVSRDKGETWKYLGDVDYAASDAADTWIHMNLGVMATKDAVIVTAAKTVQLEGDSAAQWHNYLVRIEKDSLADNARFAAVNSVRDPLSKKSNATGARLPLAGTLLISSNGRHVWAGGETFAISGVNGKRTLLTAEMIAAFLGGTLELSGDTAVITVGNTRYSFTAGTKTADIAGQTAEMTFAAAAENGTVLVSVEDLGNLLHLSVQKTESGAILLRTDHTPVDFGYLLANAGLN